MLYEIYTAMKERLASLEMPQEWYNVQYEETIINERGFFIEFPDKLQFVSDSRELRRAPIKIRLHVYSKALRTTNGIPDLTVDAHEAIALDAKKLLDGYTLPNTSCSRLTFSGWQHWHRYRGWMVTFIEFDAKITI